MQRKLTTIVAMDFVGYSRLMERDESGTLDRLRDLRTRVLDPVVASHSGRIVKLMGDGTLLEFGSVVSALQCAIDIQESLGSENAPLPEGHRLDLRIGVHLGDVVVDGDDIYGDGVNVAARLESLAEPGGIILSKQVHDHIGGKVRANFVPMGEQSVKNLSRMIEAFRVEPEGQGARDVISFGAYELDVAHFELRHDGSRVAVEPQVFDLIVLLVRNRDRTVTKDEIFSAIWGDRVVSDAALSSQIKSARRVLGDNGSTQKMIATVHGRGFRFVPETNDSSGSASSGAPAEEALSAIASRPSVGVLPFTNMNRDEDEDYLGDGFAEDITTALTKNRWLTIVARNSAFAFRG
jgi:class 3 adenylate cyclase/DNA-binding winged helix-turn-helix (wHTH) protein